MKCFFSLLLLFCHFLSNAATITSTTSGNWSATGTWVGGVVPTSGDAVVIALGHSVNVDGDYSCTTLTINSDGTTTVTILASNTLTVSGAVTLSTGTTSTVSTLAVGDGTLTAASIALLASSSTRATKLSINNGTVNVTGNITTASSLGSAVPFVIFTGAGTINITGTFLTNSYFSGNLTSFAGSTVNFNGTSQSIRGYTYNNLTLSGTGSSTGPEQSTVNGNLSITGFAFTPANSGTLAIGGNLTIGDDASLILGSVVAMTVAGTSSIGGGASGTVSFASTPSRSFTGAVTVNAGGLLKFTSSAPVLTFTGGISYSAGSTLEYNSTVSRTAGVEWPATNSPPNVSLTSSGVITMPGSRTISELLTLTSGTLAIAANTLTLNGGTSITSGQLTGGATSNLVMGATATLPSGLTSLLNFTLNAGTTTIGAAITLTSPGVLALDGGKVVTTTTNLITVNNTATTGVTGGSSTSYVDGPLKWLLTTTAGDLYAFPVGKGGKYLSMTYTGNTVASQSVQVEAFSTFCGGSVTSPASSFLAGEHWSIKYTAATTVGTVAFNRTYSLGAYDIIGTCATVNGVYQSLGGSISGNSITATSAVNTWFTIAAASTKFYSYVASGGCSTYSGTLTVGPTSTFNSLTHAISLLNSCGYSGNIILALQSDYNGTSAYETFPITFPSTFAAVASSSSRVITIQPAAGVSSTLSIIGSATASSANIVLNGADYIVFDGRPIGGSTNYLTISNSSTTAGAAVKFIDDATNNTFQYCTLTSTFYSTTIGVVWFSTSSVTTGNDDNTFDYCIIDGAAGTNASPTTGIAKYGIYSLGTSGKANGPNSITNCQFKDIFVSATTSAGIFLSTYNDNWTISNNSFYQTETRTAAGNSTVNFIKIVDGDDYTINSNFVGGSAASCSGTWTQTQTGSNYTIFYGIEMACDAAGTVSNIQGNTFTAMNWSAYGNTSEFWVAIKTTAGNFNIGTNTGNTFGASSGTGALTFSHGVGTVATTITMIDVATANTVTIQSNTIGSITMGNINNKYYTFTGIKSSGAGTLDIQSNQIANTDAESIQIGGTSSSGTFSAISNTGTGVVTISNNNVGSVNSAMGTFYGIHDNAAAGANAHIISDNTIGTTGTGTGSIYASSAGATIYGINIGSTGTNYTIDANTIRNITMVGGSSPTATGIYAASTGTYNMDGNSISNLKNTEVVSGAGKITGIKFNGINASSVVQKNSMTGFSTLTTSGPTIYGIWNVSTGTVLLYNNLFICDNGGNTNNCLIFGIYSGAAAIITMYHNTISISGTNASAITDPHSSCVNLVSATVNQVLGCKNNIFQNARIAGNTEKHYSYRMGGLTVDKTAGNIDYNYYAAKVDASFAAPGSTGITSATFNQGLKGYGGVNSKYFSPGAGNNSSIIAINADGSLSAADLAVVGTGADLHLTPGIVDDINGVVGGRAAGAGYLGCYEGSSGFYWVGGTGDWSDYLAHWATASGGGSFNSAAPTASDIVNFDASSGGGTVTIDGASTCADFIGTGYTGTIAGTNGLTVSGSLTVGAGMSWSQTGALILNATAAGKTITSNGVSLSAPITLNGSGGVWTLADNLTTTDAFTLTDGTVDLSTFNLSVGGNLSLASAATFTPSTGTITFTGNSASITGTTAAPSFYNLIVNKTAGQTLSTAGSVTSLTVTNDFTETLGNFTAPATMAITGITTLTAGTFTAPSGTLTLSGDFTDNGGTFTHNGGTLTFTGNSSAINGTDAAETFNNVIVNKTSGQTLSTAGSMATLTVDSDFTETQGNFTAPATMNVTGNSLLTAGTFTAPSGTLTLSGDFTDNGGTFTHNNGTTTFTGNSSTINGTDADETFYNLIVNKTSGQTLSTGGSMVTITVASNFTETQGNFTAPATMNITGVTTLTAGTFTAPSGTLTLSNDLVSNTTFTHNSGLVTFDGSAPQLISGSTNPVFYDLTNSNSSTGLSLGLNTEVENELTLNTGLLKTDEYTLSIGTSSANGILTGGSSTAYIVAYDNAGKIGYLKHFVNLAAGTNYSFPIGDAASYTPLTFTLTTGTLSNAYVTSYTNAAKITGVNSNITEYINRSWDISASGISSPSYTAAYTYADGDIVGGTEVGLLPVKKSGTTWYQPTEGTFASTSSEGSGSSTAGSNLLTWSGQTTFGVFGGVVNGVVVLPVELISFTGKKVGRYNELTWQTASEKNNDFFTLEKTNNGEEFEVVGTVKGAGSVSSFSDYSLWDYEVGRSINYYRLKQTDYDGKCTFSEVISIDNFKDDHTLGLEVVSTTNIQGQEVNDAYRGLVIIKYSDGTSKKIML
jgi:hypothetical protein